MRPAHYVDGVMRHLISRFAEFPSADGALLFAREVAPKPRALTTE